MSDKHKDIEHWSRIASEWMVWARAPNHDAFWAYRGSLLAFIGQSTGGRSRCGLWRGASLTRFEGMRLPGDSDRFGREARIGSRAGWISGRLRDRGGG